MAGLGARFFRAGHDSQTSFRPRSLGTGAIAPGTGAELFRTAAVMPGGVVNARHRDKNAGSPTKSSDIHEVAPEMQVAEGGPIQKQDGAVLAVALEPSAFLLSSNHRAKPVDCFSRKVRCEKAYGCHVEASLNPAIECYFVIRSRPLQPQVTNEVDLGRRRHAWAVAIRALHPFRSEAAPVEVRDHAVEARAIQFLRAFDTTAIERQDCSVLIVIQPKLASGDVDQSNLPSGGHVGAARRLYSPRALLVLSGPFGPRHHRAVSSKLE